jgi:tetratricopeptide (TPR) repeat protein
MSDELVLRFGQKEPDGSYPVFIGDEPVGVFQPPFSGDLTAEVVETEAAVLEHWAGAAPGERTVLLGILERLARRLTAMGVILSEALFVANPPLAEALADAPADASLVLQFEPDERELLRLPWEYLTDPDGRRLAALHPLARRLGPPSPLQGEEPGVRGNPVRLLACIAEPLDQGPLDGQTVRERLMDATRPLREAGWLELRFLPLPATPDRLASALTDWRPDVVHLACHGLPGILALEGERGGTQRVTAEQIRHRFASCPPRLVVLGACLSAAALKGDPLAATATAFLRAGVSAVVAMQFSAQVESVNRFVGDLYAALAGEERRPLDVAIRDARANRFFASDFVDAYQWGVPVLYLQSREADLFAGMTPGKPQPDEAVPGLPQPSPSNVPSRTKPFLGRGPEMAEVNFRLGRDRLVVLHGEGGIGKTALARELAEWHARRGTYSGGVAWVDLQTPRTAEAIVEEVGVALVGEEFRRMSGDRAAWLQEYLRQYHTLLVLDNFETVGRDPAVLGFVQGVSAPSAILLTSRERVGGLARQGLPELKAQTGHALFVEWAVRSGWDGAGDGARVREICGVLDYMPLAIELVAPQATELPLPVLLRRVKGSLAAVAADRPDLPPRHRSVEATLRLSYQGLSPEAQRLLARLAVFPGGAYPYEFQDPDGQATDAIRLVSDLADWEPAAVELVGKGLLRLEGQRYGMHGLVRQYGLERLEEAGERAEVERQAAEFFLALAQLSNSLMGTDQARAGLAMVETERANLLWGQEWHAEQEEWDGAIAYGYALGQPFSTWGYWADSLLVIQRAAAAAESKGDKGHQSALMSNLGIVTQDQGDYQAARRYYEQSLEIAQALGYRAGVALATWGLGNIAYAQGDYDEARGKCQEALAVFEELGDRKNKAGVLHQLGVLAQDQRDYPAARRYYQQSLEIKQTLGDRAGVSRSLHQLGTLAQDQGDYAAARRFYQQAGETFQDLGARKEQSAVLHQLGMLAQDQGDCAAARRFYQQSLEISQALGDRAQVAGSTGQLGRLAELEGDYIIAVRLWAAALATFEALHSPHASTVRGWFARLREELGEETFERVLEEAQDNNSESWR